VYNLSAMTQSEATALVNKTEGRLCVRFYRRPDGTMLTRDCPVGLRALKRRAAWVTQVLLGMLLSLLAGLGLLGFKRHVALVRAVTMGMMVVPALEERMIGCPTQEEETKKKSPKKSAPSKANRTLK